MLECHGLATGYVGRSVSSGIELAVLNGEIVCLIGPNGCGKTTLLKTVAGLLPPQAGTILLDGEELHGMDRRSLARKRAYLPQIQRLPDLTVEMLVSHGRFPHLGFSRKLTAHDQAAIASAMELTGVTSWRAKKLSELSGGQRQRAYLAMTAAQDTPLLLWDEPTTYLDAASRLEVMTLVRRLREIGKTVVMTLQDLPDALTVADRVCVMDGQGRICLMGTPETVLTSGIIRQVFGLSVEQVTLSSGNRAYVLDATI